LKWENRDIKCRGSGLNPLGGWGGGKKSATMRGACGPTADSNVLGEKGGKKQLQKDMQGLNEKKSKAKVSL